MPKQPQTAEPALALRSVVKRFGAQLALDELDLELGHGDTLALVGPSGCGKTTALRLLNGLTQPDAGHVRVFGEPLGQANLLSHRRTTGYVIQEVGLLPHWTVARNIATALTLKGTPQAETDARVKHLLSEVGLAPRDAQKMPSQLSGGQRQRVGIARALAAKPRLLLMDEPFGALDPLNRVRLRRLMNRLRREQALTMVLVTHDLDDARALADRVCVMRDGKVVESLRGDGLEQAKDPWVQEFLEPGATGGRHRTGESPTA